MNVAYSGSPGSADNVTSPIQRGPQIVEHKPDRTSESIRTRSFAGTGASDRYRREADAAVRSSGGPLTEPTPAVQPSRREPLFMPPHLPFAIPVGIGSVGGKLSFIPRPSVR